jgi:hypothetical protein
MKHAFFAKHLSADDIHYRSQSEYIGAFKLLILINAAFQIATTI